MMDSKIQMTPNSSRRETEQEKKLKAKQKRDKTYINYITNFPESLQIFNEKDIYNCQPGTEELRRLIILTYDFPNRKQKLASLPDLLAPPHLTSSVLFQFLDLLPELLTRGHDINETSSRGSLLHILRQKKMDSPQDNITLHEWRQQLKSLGALDFVLRH